MLIVLGIVLFGLLVAVHEAGHFLTAKLLDVQVNEFSVGMGPAIWKKQKGETQYSFRLLPIGGYCAMEGEDGEETEDEDGAPKAPNPRAFCRKSPWKRFLILVAGPAANLLSGFLIVLVLFSAMGGYTVPVIQGFMPGVEAVGQGGLMPGDRVLAINGHKVSVYGDLQLELAAAKERKTQDLVVRRDGRELALNGLPLTPQTFTVNGEEVERYGLMFSVEKATPAGVLRQSVGTCGYFARSVWMGLGMLVRGEVGLKDMSGPVGIVSFMGETANDAKDLATGLQNIFYFIALIAVNLAVMNLLPIPALDGGRIFFMVIAELYRLFTRRELDPKYESALNGVGFVLLMGLMVVVTFSDVFKIIT